MKKSELQQIIKEEIQKEIFGLFNKKTPPPPPPQVFQKNLPLHLYLLLSLMETQ